MTYLADALIRSTLVLLAGLAAVALLRHRSSALRHWILTATIGAAAVAAPLSWLLPDWPVAAVSAPVTLVFERPLPATEAPARALESAATAIESVTPAPPRRLPIEAMWLLGFAAGAGVMLVQLGRLARISARASRLTDRRWLRMVDEVRSAYGIHRGVPVLSTRTADLLATWGVFRPCILVPPGASRWDDDLIQVVVSHELAHVRRHDWAVQIAADLVRRLYWFQPLMWIACRMLRRASEQACDDVVLGTGVAAPAYAGHLLHLARAGRTPYGWAAAVPMARPSTLERRIAAMLDNARNRRALSFRAIVATTLALSAATFSAAAFHAEQNRPTQLAGTIYDGSGGVLPGVAVTLTDAQGVKADATTDASGRFYLPAAAGGKYVLEASVPGFNSFRQEFTLPAADGGAYLYKSQQVTMSPASDWDRVITLQVGKLSETITVKAKRDPSTQATPGAPKPTPVRVGGNIKAPMKLVDVHPVYPASMRAAGRSGVVPLDALIGTDGTVVFARVVSASVHPDFADAAVEAVRQWKFTPTLLNGKPVEVWMGVTVNFALEQ
jgi:TonB family protein